MVDALLWLGVLWIVCALAIGAAWWVWTDMMKRLGRWEDEGANGHG